MRAYIFDADGVLTVPEELFSHVYAKRYNLPIEPFERFFKEQFSAALIGEADLKKLLANNKSIWRYGSPDDILREWLESENVQDNQALDVIKELRRRGDRCYLATNQEKYRGAYMRDVMFEDLFDAYFISGEMGAKKPEAEYFRQVIRGIQEDVPRIRPEEIVFFDDTPSHVEGAQRLGIDAMLYENIDQIKSLL